MIITEQTSFGIDVLLDEFGDPITTANGDLEYGMQYETMLQDIRLRLLTELGELFWGPEIGIPWAHYEAGKIQPQDIARLKMDVYEQVLQDYRVGAAEVDVQYNHETSGVFIIIDITPKNASVVLKLVIDKEVEKEVDESQF